MFFKFPKQPSYLRIEIFKSGKDVDPLLMISLKVQILNVFNNIITYAYHLILNKFITTITCK